MNSLLRAQTIQPKLTISHPDDPYEREADRVADQVMRMPDPKLGLAVQRSPRNIQRVCQNCQHELQYQFEVNRDERGRDIAQAKRKPVSGDDATNLESYLGTTRGGGELLSRSTRDFFEPRFGHDFSKVHVFTDGRAAASAAAVNAEAFTLGNNIVFGAGHYAPQSTIGRRLLAHELSHVVQQSGSGQLVVRRRTVRRDYATAASERGPLCDVRLTITGAPDSDTDDLADFIDAAMNGIRMACGSLPRSASHVINVRILYRRKMEFSDVERESYVAGRVSVLGRAADPAFIAEQQRIATAARLESNYTAAVSSGNWQMAAEYLNGFNDADITTRLRRLNLTQLGELRRGATINPRLGGGARLIAAIDAINRDAARVAALIHSYESALASSDWASAAEHLNGFSDSDIRERLRRLDRLELSVLRDGAIRNPRLGRGTRLVNLIDSVAAPALTGVGAACFDGATITVTKNRATHSCSAFTGSTGDPTPSGRFCVRMQGTAIIAGGLTGRVLQDREVWYLLEPQFPTTRFKMILHPGVQSSGCITVNDRACFDQLAVVLNGPGIDTGRGYDGYPPGNSAGVAEPERSVVCVAWLDVTSTRGGCGP
ncbi:MAG: DUF4157 domain-containing protein [Pyrinomonadaceae bacterium]